jgi:hypothetical protein
MTSATVLDILQLVALELGHINYCRELRGAMVSRIQNLNSKIQNGIMAFRYTDAFVTLAAADAEVLVQFYRQLLDREPNPYIRNVYAEFQVSGLYQLAKIMLHIVKKPLWNKSGLCQEC